jgi:transcriptional regulator with XRE-family HTH domain
VWHGGVPTNRDTVHPAVRAKWARHRKDVGSRIRHLRLEAGLTQQALALESGLTRNVLIDLEWGRRGVLFERLFDIAAALGVPVTALFAESSAPDEQ